MKKQYGVGVGMEKYQELNGLAVNFVFHEVILTQNNNNQKKNNSYRCIRFVFAMVIVLIEKPVTMPLVFVSHLLMPLVAY